MSKNSNDPQVFLEHIIDSINHIERYIKDLNKRSFLEFKNETIQDAVVRRIEIIGEAVRNLPSEFKQKHTDIPWLDISDMRNKLIHEYFGVDLELVFEVAKNDLPILKKQIHELLNS